MPTKKQKQAAVTSLTIDIRIAQPRSLSANAFAAVLEQLSRLIIDAEREELDFYQQQFPDVSPFIFSAARHELSQLEHKALTISAARQGSIVIELSPGAIALFLLTAVASDVIKESWKKVELQKKLVEILSTSLEKKAKSIAGKFLFSKRAADDCDITAHTEQRGETLAIVLLAEPTEMAYRIPEPSELLASLHEEPTPGGLAKARATPNPSIERTRPGKPGRASHVKR